MIEAVVFDVDGVLIDSVPSAHRVKTRLLKEYGVDLEKIPDPHGEQHKGSSSKVLLDAVQEHAGLAIDHKEFSAKASKAIYQDLTDSNICADPGLCHFLNELKENDIKLAIASSGVRRSVENKLKILGIRDFFQVVITANDVTAHKPDPESYLAAMDNLVVDPGKTIVFEDSLAGITAGRAAGATVIGFTQYNDDKPSLKGTALTIDNWGEISLAKLNLLNKDLL